MFKEQKKKYSDWVDLHNKIKKYPIGTQNRTLLEIYDNIFSDIKKVLAKKKKKK